MLWAISPNMRSVSSAWSNRRFIEIEHNFRRKKFNRPKYVTNFLKSSFCYRGNIKKYKNPNIKILYWYIYIYIYIYERSYSPNRKIHAQSYSGTPFILCISSISLCVVKFSLYSVQTWEGSSPPTPPAHPSFMDISKHC